FQLRRALLELEPCQQPIFSPGNLPSLAQIGNLELGLLEHFLGSKARSWQDAGERGGVKVVVLGRLAGTGGEGDDHAIELAFCHQSLDRILDTLSECDVAAGVDDDEAGLRRRALQRFGDLSEADTENGQLLGQVDPGANRNQVVLTPLGTGGRAMTGIVEKSYSVGTCHFEALDEVRYCCPQGGLVSVPDDYDVVLLEPNGLQARCDHLPIPVGIGKRTDLYGVGGIGDNEGETRLGVRRSWNRQHSCDREIPQQHQYPPPDHPIPRSASTRAS